MMFYGLIRILVILSFFSFFLLCWWLQKFSMFDIDKYVLFTFASTFFVCVCVCSLSFFISNRNFQVKLIHSILMRHIMLWNVYNIQNKPEYKREINGTSNETNDVWNSVEIESYLKWPTRFKRQNWNPVYFAPKAHKIHLIFAFGCEGNASVSQSKRDHKKCAYWGFIFNLILCHSIPLEVNWKCICLQNCFNFGNFCFQWPAKWKECSD